MLKIKNLKAGVEEIKILNGIATYIIYHHSTRHYYYFAHLFQMERCQASKAIMAMHMTKQQIQAG